MSHYLIKNNADVGSTGECFNVLAFNSFGVTSTKIKGVWLLLCIPLSMSTFPRWHFVVVTLFLPRFVVGQNLAQRTIGHVVDFGTVKPDWLHPVTRRVNYLGGSIRRAACRGQNQDCCAELHL